MPAASRRQPLTALGVVGKQLPEMQALDSRMMLLQQLSMPDAGAKPGRSALVRSGSMRAW